MNVGGFTAHWLRRSGSIWSPDVLESNVVHDRKVESDLEHLGWKVVTIWECAIWTPYHLARIFEGSYLNHIQAPSCNSIEFERVNNESG